MINTKSIYIKKKPSQMTKEQMQELYKKYENYPSGSIIKCPYCGEVFQKTYKRIFCSTFCREAYRQLVNPPYIKKKDRLNNDKELQKETNNYTSNPMDR